MPDSLTYIAPPASANASAAQNRVRARYLDAQIASWVLSLSEQQVAQRACERAASAGAEASRATFL